MTFKSFTGPGSTRARRRFWDDAINAVRSSEKVAGRNVTVDVHPGQGSVINVPDRGRIPPSEIGACCHIDGSCTIETEADCEDVGGSYQGNDTICEDIDCTHTGACCHFDGSCTIERQADCVGTYQGDGTDCDPNPCPPSSCSTPCYPTSMTLTVTPSGDVGIRGECQIDPPGRVTLLSTPVVFEGDVELDGSTACCSGGLSDNYCFPVEAGTNQECCSAFGSTCALFNVNCFIEWCPDTMQWRVCSEIGIGGGATGYCNWPLITISFFPSGESDCFTDISDGQSTVNLTLESSDWSFLTFDMQIDLTWTGCG